MEERVVDKVIQRLKKTPIKNLREATVSTSESQDAGTLQEPTPVETIISPVPEMKERRGWFLFDLLGEFRTIGQMTFDHRYRFSWLGRTGPIVIAVLYIFMWFLIGGSGLLGIFERIFDIILAVMFYHILSREARLYRSRQS
jgi:hypothetical protein